MADHQQTMTDAVARAFVAARREGAALSSYPGERPRDLTTGYRIQDRAIALMDRRVGGWKVGRINPPLDEVDRLAGPIFEDRIVAHLPEPSMPIFADGFGAAEAEFLLRIGTAPDPTKTSFTTEKATALIDAVHVGIEIASSPFPGINDHGAPVTISDFGNNDGLIVGPAIASDLVDAPVELCVNGDRVGSGTVRTMLDGPFGAARFLFENLAARGIPVRRGQWISTGAVTGVHRVRPGDRVEARFGGGHRLLCRIVAR